MAAAIFATAVSVGQPAEYQDDGGPNLGCNDNPPRPGASCGCVRREGQPFGRCVAY